MQTEQTNFWSGSFGKEYTDRNSYSHVQVENDYMIMYGKTKSQLNSEFLGNLDKNISILEVGCNTGMQLILLQNMGFSNLNGVELQSYAVEQSKKYCKGINIVQGSGFQIPFPDSSFDLVYTHGVLIHIHPDDLLKIMSEMVRVSKKYIFGLEYYQDDIQELRYRGNEGFMWKADYCKLFQESFPGLKLLKKKMLPYICEEQKGNQDCMYLLSK